MNELNYVPVKNHVCTHVCRNISIHYIHFYFTSIRNFVSLLFAISMYYVLKLDRTFSVKVCLHIRTQNTGSASISSEIHNYAYLIKDSFDQKQSFLERYFGSDSCI